MARNSRCFEAGTPYHVTERGVDRDRVFFQVGDRVSYLTLASSLRQMTQVRVLAWCLMSNHVHWVVAPERVDSLPQFFRHLQGRYAQAVNARRGRVGHLWQNRYFACALDRTRLWTAIRYVELNPVRAGMVSNPLDYRWSSAALHANGPSPEKPQLLDWEFWREHGGATAWREMLGVGDDALTVGNLRASTYAGKPFGSEQFVEKQEKLFGRHWRNVGRPKKDPQSEIVPLQTDTDSFFVSSA
jgi:putative transposase